MASTRTRRSCAKCNNGGVASCNGCRQMFCVNHFTEHREEISKLMDNVSEEHDSLQGDLVQENLEHHFLSHIDIWEQESIKKIQTAAQTARTKLQQIFNRKKDNIKHLVEDLTNELQYSRETDDYTESDINKWTEKLKTFRETLKDWSTVDIENDNQAESIIRLIKICDQHDEQFLSIDQSSEKLVQIYEKFDKIDTELILSNDNLVATCHSKYIFSNRFIYGINRYSSGTHSIQFSIERKGDVPLFLGIITSSKKYDQSYFNPNNSSVHGWYNIKSFVIGGKSQEYNEENVLITGDKLTLKLDCDNQQISLQHQRTKRHFQISVKLETCPFPWKIIIGLSNFNDCIRIIN